MLHTIYFRSMAAIGSFKTGMCKRVNDARKPISMILSRESLRALPQLLPRGGVTIGFRVIPEHGLMARTSGMAGQDHLYKRVLEEEIVIEREDARIFGTSRRWSRATPSLSMLGVTRIARASMH